MRRIVFGLVVLAAGWAGNGFAEEVVFDPIPPLDLEGVSPEFVDEMFGQWTISSAEGDRTCQVELLEETSIGGMAIDVDPTCVTTFPVMDNVTAWRLLEGWAIDFVDAERKTIMRFTTPDDRYVAYPEIDGIATIAPSWHANG